MAGKWIQKAVSKHPGAFSAAAKRAGMSTKAYAEREKGAGGKTGKRARLALTLLGMKKKAGGKVPGDVPRARADKRARKG